MTLIPLYSKTGHIIQTYKFKENLNLYGPRYLNEGANMGLLRDKKGRLILMYQHEEFPSSDHAEVLSENEAYELCLNRGKQCLVDALHITPQYEEVSQKEDM